MRDDRDFVVYGMRETYHELGEYEFKIVLSPALYKSGHESNLTMVDSDGRPMLFEAKKWGRKINCRFKIDESVPDGVSSVKLELKRSNGSGKISNLRFWVVK